MALRMDSFRKDDVFELRMTEGQFDPGITRFVADVYYYHKNYHFSESYSELLERMLEEDRLLAAQSKTFTIYHAQQMVSTIRLIRKSRQTLLPVEREFGLQLEELGPLMGRANHVYELARFASATSQSRAVMMLLRELICCTGLDDLMLAGLDACVLHKTRRIGLHWVEIGEGKHYLGSLTHPVALHMRNHVAGIFTPYVEQKIEWHKEVVSACTDQ